MPRRDGTGPMGYGSKTGRGRGFCTTSEEISRIGKAGLGLGLGLGCRRGFGRRCFNNTISLENERDLLMEQKAIFENRLNLLNDQLDNLSDSK